MPYILCGSVNTIRTCPPQTSNNGTSSASRLGKVDGIPLSNKVYICTCMNLCAICSTFGEDKIDSRGAKLILILILLYNSLLHELSKVKSL